MNIIVTGGAGFIGSAVIRYIINRTRDNVLNIDKLTYAGNLESLKKVAKNPRYQFAQIDICDRGSLRKVLTEFKPNVVMHLAAESHVDRSIDAPMDFIQTNIVGTCILLSEVSEYYYSLSQSKKNSFIFHHISTDEVFGDLQDSCALFNEDTPYRPSSPYSASKASLRSFCSSLGTSRMVFHRLSRIAQITMVPINFRKTYTLNDFKSY